MPTLYTALKARSQATRKRQIYGGPSGMLSEVMKLPTIEPAKVPRAKHISLLDRYRVKRFSGKAPVVIVVGAGFAGLSAGYELKTLGYDVKILEAQSEHIGGRVKSIRNWVGSKVAEGGAELIGTNHPAWRSYASKFRLPFLEVPDGTRNDPVFLKGMQLDDKQSKHLLKEMKVALGTLNKDAKKIRDPFRPWIDPKLRKLDKMSVAERIRQLPVSLLCMLALDELLEGDNGVPTDSQSYLGLLAMIKGGGVEKYWDDTETHRCEGGNTRLAESFATSIGNGRLLQGKPVEWIKVRPQKVIVGSKFEAIEGQYVILAVPPSVWSEIKITGRFRRRGKPQMGKNVKFLMGLNKSFWTTEEGPNFSSDGPINLTWEGTANQSGPDDLRTLIAFSGGDDARICSSWPSSERLERYVHELERAYSGVRESIVKSEFEDWPNTDWAKASYSFPAPGEVAKLGPYLNNPQGRLHFAGEHTCYAFVGYMEGALQSGLRVAERIAMQDGIISKRKHTKTWRGGLKGPTRGKS